MKKLISILLALVMTAAIAAAGFAMPEQSAAEDPVNLNAVKTVEKAAADVDMNETVTLIVELKDAPTAARVSDLASKSAQSISNALKAKQAAVQDRIASMLASDAQMEVVYNYTLLFNGFAVRVPRYMKSRIAAIPGVKKVSVSPRYAVPQLVEEEPEKLATSAHYISADYAWDAGYTGAGTVIAIIDTGCAVDHAAFATAPAGQKMDADYLAAVLANEDLHAEELYADGTLSENEVYYSGKIPYRFNYGNGTNDVGHAYAQSDHGTHVAGIAAGYNPENNNTGIAKDAQLAIMQVFDSDGGAGWDTILAALEDCAYLGVDAVNMSLGSDLGYTSDGPRFDDIFDLAASHGINIACAAGNSGRVSRQYYGSNHDYALAMNPDNGLVSSPGTYAQSMCAAACEKTGLPSITYFSSRGTTADLKLKPEITAPGRYIDGPVDPEFTGGGDQYQQKSGTSMASPHLAGAMALLTNYVSVTWPELTGQDKTDMVNRLLMCTADPAARTSPRAQGSGVINIEKAITTGAFITVPNCSRPKLELGDDPDKTGVYTLSFSIVNFGETELNFAPSVTVLTEDTVSKTINGQLTDDLNIQARDITSDCSIGGSESITVPAGSTREVTLTVTLSSELKSKLDSIFPNGIYIDGNVVLKGEVDLTVPFLGFYGSWSRASVFDRNTYFDEIQGVNNYNIHTLQTTVGAMVDEEQCMLFGANPYIESDDWWADRCTLSPNGDGCYEQIDRLTYAIIRNAGEGGLKIFNEDDPETVYYYEDLSGMPKSWKLDVQDESSFIYSSDLIQFESWSPETEGLAEGTHIVFKLYHYLDYENFDPAQNECCEIVLPMTVDTTAPEITYWNVEEGTLTVRVHDEHYAAWIGVYADADCTELITERAIAERTRGANTDLTLNVGDRDTVFVKVGDYGRNTSLVCELTGEGGSMELIDLESISLDPAQLEMIVGDTAMLSLVKVPTEANNFSIAWTSSNPSVVAVAGDRNGAELTAVSRGAVRITATAVNYATGETFTAYTNVTVGEFVGYERVDRVDEGGKYIIVADSSVTGSIGYAVGNTTVPTTNKNLLPVMVSINADDMIVVDPSIDFDSITWIPQSYQSGYSWKNVGNSKYIGFNSNKDLYPSSSPFQWTYDDDRAFENQYDPTYKYLNYSAATGSSQARYRTGRTAAPIRLYKLIENEPYVPVIYTVTFADWDGTVISTVEVEEGCAASAPADPVRAGYRFIGWDGDFSFVTEDITVTAMYEEDFLLGDVNLDGFIRIDDALMTMRHAMNIILLSGQGLLNANVNGDNTVNTVDALAIMRIALLRGTGFTITD